MITEKIEKILNEQIEKEGYSSNLYLSMASWAETEGFAGISKWFYVIPILLSNSSKNSGAMACPVLKLNFDFMI